jgi:hypothetical protein
MCHKISQPVPRRQMVNTEPALHVVNLIDLLVLTDSAARLINGDVICKHEFTNLSRSGNACNAGNAAIPELLIASI